MAASGRKWSKGLVGAAILLALLGFTITAVIVREEGWEGLWRRKREWVDSNHPVLSPVMDEAERRVR